MEKQDDSARGQSGNNPESTPLPPSSDGTPTVQLPSDPLGSATKRMGAHLSKDPGDSLGKAITPAPSSHPEDDSLALASSGRGDAKEFQSICGSGLGMFMFKNKQYGNSIRWTGVLGCVVECVAKTARLIQLVMRDPKHGRDNSAEVLDTLRDLHNYAVIGIMLLHEHNWEGKDPE